MRAVQSDLGGQVFGLDAHVIELYLFVLDAEFFLYFGRTDTDAIGDELTEFFLNRGRTSPCPENRHGELESLHDFTLVGIHADESVAVKRRREILADAVGAFLVADGDSEPFGFVFNFLLKNKLIEDLPSVESFELLAGSDYADESRSVACVHQPA